MLHIVRRDPRQYDEPNSRWTLAGIRRVCDWLQHLSDAGVSRALHDLRIHWRRGRDYIHSPDPDYDEKMKRIKEIWRDVRGAATEMVLLFLDELTYYRQPTLGYSYEASDSAGPLARRGYGTNTSTRIIGTLNGLTGEVCYLQRSKVGLAGIVKLYEQVAQRYAWARRIYVVQDNWPVHFHPDVLAALEAQETPFAWCRPPRWSDEPTAKARRLNLPIQLVQLPTYASWANPIEKLWRYAKQTILHMHPWAENLPELRRHVTDFLDQFRPESEDLLRYVGLLRPK